MGRHGLALSVSGEEQVTGCCDDIVMTLQVLEYRNCLHLLLQADLPS